MQHHWSYTYRYSYLCNRYFIEIFFNHKSYTDVTSNITLTYCFFDSKIIFNKHSPIFLRKIGIVNVENGHKISIILNCTRKVSSISLVQHNDTYGSVANEIESAVTCYITLTQPCLRPYCHTFLSKILVLITQRHTNAFYTIMLTWITSCRRLVKPIRSDMNIPFLSYLRFDLRLPLALVMFLFYCQFNVEVFYFRLN